MQLVYPSHGVKRILKQRDRLGILTFDNQVFWKLKPRPLREVRINRDLQAVLQNIFARGSTAIYDAIDTVLSSMHSPTNHTAIILGTDGEDNASGKNLQDLTKTLESRPNTQLYVLDIHGVAATSADFASFCQHKQVKYLLVKENDIEQTICSTVQELRKKT